MATMDVVNDILSSEALISETVVNEYSDVFHSLLRANWINLACSLIISADLICNQAKYRFAYRREDERIIDYWPAKLGDHAVLVNFVKTIIFFKYVRMRQAVFCNMSLDMFIQEEDGSSSYLYSSRSNFNLWDNSFLIYNVRTFHIFMKRFKDYDLLSFVKEAVAMLSPDYDGLLIPIRYI